MLLPDHVDKKFKNPSELMNAIEHIERKVNSQILKEYVLALPDDKNISLEMKKEMVNEFIKEMKWIEEGLAVQVDIHAPDKEDNNSHVHLLAPTRRFTEDGQRLGAKARDLEPQVRGGRSKTYVKSSEEVNLGKLWTKVQNTVFKNHGLETRVDAIGKIAQEHIGPVRMRSVMNAAVYRNEERVQANIEDLMSGQRVLERVTAFASVFNKGDLERAVKIVPDTEARARLVEDAFSSGSLISLYDESGKATGYYTTTEIRAEEEKLLRLGGYVANSKSCISLLGANSLSTANRLINDVRVSLTEERREQHKALSHLLLGDSGIRILRGRAGSGKSHVLGHVQRIATSVGVNVIGLAPTHKARGELAKVGYEQNDTIKGMLFKLKNDKFYLPKGSLLVVDEAGMVGNDDFKELLRVGASRKCNVIMSGDEKQLASVQRGGMFEVFAEKYGSVAMLNIQRQDDAWGRGVAMAFSNGEVSSGISILQEKNRIVENATKDESMQVLLADWSKSREKLEDRLIIAVANRDVNALNHGVRQYLKLSGDLRGDEISVAGSHYMKGDRILIKDTNKELGLVNGNFATVMHVSKERFVISLEGEGGDNSGITNDNKRVIEFNPSLYSGFKHGYATTVFKAQGASIKDVYVFHDGFAGIRNSYVALSRNVKNLHLYINNQATKSVAHLIKQLGHDPETGSSLSYLTKTDLQNREIDANFAKSKNILNKMAVGALGMVVKALDKHIPSYEYYNFKAPELKREKVEAVLDMVGREVDQEAVGNVVVMEEQAVVGGNSNYSILDNTNIIANKFGNITNSANVTNSNINGSNSIRYSNKVKQTAKERFYTNADRVRSRSDKLQQSIVQQKAQWDMEAERLRSEVKFRSEAIARDLLGEPNKHLSNGKTLRFGEHGKIAVRISGERMGSWFDFSSDKGGDMFALVQDKQGCDFKGAAEYLRRAVGMEVGGSNSHLQLVHDHRNSDLLEKQIKARRLEEKEAKAKALQVEKLYARAKDIGNKSVAYKYLTTHRGLDLTGDDRDNLLGNDIKTTGIYVREANDINSSNKEKGRYLPAIVAFARDAEGNVTGGQHILLNKKTGNKADVAVTKKSFGKIAGSFVDVGNVISANNQLQSNKNAPDAQANKLTIIAEGLETALSVKQALREHSKKENGGRISVLCSLGISNIRNYHPEKGEKIIIAADNDGIDSNTGKTIENAKIALEEKGAFVEVVKPAKEGDFNDVLQDKKNGGSKAIADCFKGAIARHTANTLKEYFASFSGEQSNKLDKNDKSSLAYIEKYDLPQNAIVEAYRKGNMSGKLELEQVRKSLEMAVSHYENNAAVLDEATRWGYKNDKINVVQSLIGMDTKQSSEHCIGIRDSALNGYLTKNLSEFKEQKQSKDELELLKPIIRAEQEFLKTTYESCTTPIDKQSAENQEYLHAGKIASEKPEILENVFSLVSRLLKTGANMKASLEELQNTSDLKASCKKIGDKVEFHEARAARRNAERESIKYPLSVGKAKELSKPHEQEKVKDDLNACNEKDIDKILAEFKGNLSDRKLFKETVDNLKKFGKAEDLRDGLIAFKDKGMYSLERHTNTICTNNCIDVIGKDLSNIAGGKKVEFLAGKYSNKSDYLTAIGKDDNIMKYIEQSLSRCKDTELKNTLICHANQRAINKILEEFKGGLEDRKLFKESINDLQRFGKPENLRDGLVIFKAKGIDAMERHTNTICTNIIIERISIDFSNIARGKEVEFLAGRYSNKPDYLAAIGKDDNIMKYITPKSDTGQEIEKQRVLQRSKDFDFER